MARPNWEYIRVDVLLPSSHKLDDLHPAAKWTLIELWCHCGQHLTDGYVRDAIWRKTGTPAMRRQLVDVGLAERVDGGYQMHDYLEHQRSRADVQALKEKRAAAGRKGGNAKASAVANAMASDVASASAGSSPDPPAQGQREHPSSSKDASHSTLHLPGQNGKTAGHPVDDVKQVLQQNASKSVAEAEAEAEVKTSLASDDARGDVRDDVERLCEHLAERIEANGSKPPRITKRWRDAARLMLDRDQRTEQQVHAAIDWSQDHEFWRSAVLSMPKLRDKYDQLRLQASRPNGMPGGKTAMFQRAMERAQEREAHDANGHGQARGLHQRMLPAAGGE